MEEVKALNARIADVINLNFAGALLGWDQQTYMPSGGANARAEQLATLSKLAHELFVADETGQLIEDAEAAVKDADPDSDDAALVRVVRHDFDIQTKLPTTLVTDIARETTLAHEVWAKARAENDFASFAPTLARIYDLMRQKAEALGYDERPYDALLDEYEPGMKTNDVETLFAGLREDLVPFVAAIFERMDRVDSSLLHKHYDVDKQAEFGLAVIKELGYDMSRGRQDKAVHPFTTGFSINDVRITTRYYPDYLPTALFGSIHETGHAMYEQGVAQKYEGTALTGGVSLGVHESQSRLWENIVGRSRGFWTHYYPTLQATFPEQFGGVSVDEFYRMINAVSRSLIRVEADEVTYNLHIMLRFEMENDLLEGKLAVKDAPAAWNAKMEQYMGIVPPTDTQGILQDVHWSSGLVGYFPTYSLGNFLSVQYWDQALKDVPAIPEQIEQGNFEPLLAWLHENIHQYGRKYWPQDLTRRVTGEKIQTRSFVRYLKNKYTPIYDL
ncbi:MAG TPA: carboxypeptidase M32 [Aggregatilinea sp.]|uniref:carboxypeptidase M32 n=1 Tax=Aggregatilinea sp. TaxID=2806333 RepID=UPI002CC8E8F7|nr:carboxypeptidase M32 [Aggregatilinea sp.]HML24733.1 carboxypeptidase M32 [Aggregatilinea sp.]